MAKNITGPFSNTSSAVTTALLVNDQTFAGSLVNNGTIKPGDPTGIRVENASTITGSISNAGTITGGGGISVVSSTINGSIVDTGDIDGTSFGINVSQLSKIDPSARNGDGIAVTGPTFLGGITNAGSILATDEGIIVGGTTGGVNFAPLVSTFSGGITNSGTVAGGYAGIGVASADFALGATFAGGITNSGAIRSEGYGAVIDTLANDGTFAGSIVNSTGGTIQSPATAIDVINVGRFAFTGGITNSGAITVSNAGAGMNIVSVAEARGATFGGGITNTGTITATTGISIRYVGAGGIFGSVSNSGTISASNATALYIQNVPTIHGGIINTGTIAGVAGIVLSSAADASLFDAGTIVATGGTAIAFNGGGNTLTLGAGYSITGAVSGGGSDSFQLGGSGSGAFDLAKIGTQYTGFTHFAVVGGDWTVSGTGNQAWTLSAGTMEVASGGTLVDGATFAGPATLQLDSATSQLGGGIAGMAVGDAIDLRFQPFSSGDQAVWQQNGSSGTLTLETSAGAALQTLTLDGAYSSGQFGAADDTHSGTVLEMVLPTITWASAASGDFAVAANWTPAVVPGSANAAAITASGSYTVSTTADETVGSLIMAAGAALDIAGGVFTIDSGTGDGALGGTIAVASGGTLVLHSDVNNSGAIDVAGSAVQSGGSVGGLTVDGGGVALLLSGGSASGTIISSGGELYIGSAGTSLVAQVESGGAEVVFGFDSGANLSGTQYDFGGANGGTTDNGGYQLVASGATASSMTVALGGQQYVGSGGSTVSAQVEAGGAEVIFGIDSGASLSGTQYDFGTAHGGTTDSGGYQLVAPGATATSMTVEYGGEQYVGSGGTALAVQIEGGGAEVVFGFDSGASVSGTQYDYGTASGGTTYNGGEQLVAAGATAISMTVESGGQQYVGAGGTALATDIAAQGAEQVFGSDSGALVSGTQYVFGIASGGTTLTGGSQEIEFGDTAIGMSVSSGGEQNVGGGGTAIGTDIMKQGLELVHGTDLGATISGNQFVYGLASGTVVGTSGYQAVTAGGTISAASVSGGIIEIMSGASDGAAPITFAGGGRLLLDASAAFSGTVAGFDSASSNDSIDFADIAYVAAGSAGATAVTWTSGGTSSGTLTVSEGGRSANITLLGQYTGTFSPSTDGQGGTLITYSPADAATDFSSPVLAATRHA